MQYYDYLPLFKFLKKHFPQIKFILSINYVEYQYTISCLQNTLLYIYIIIVCKQTSALHIINPWIYHILRIHVFFLLIYCIKIYNLYFLFLYIIAKVKIHFKRKTIHSEKFVKLKIFLILILILTSSSLVRFGLKFDYILHYIQNFTRRRMLNVK
jgi:hypothetical protein